MIAVTGGARVSHSTLWTVALNANQLARKQNFRRALTVGHIMTFGARHAEMFAVIELAAQQPSVRNRRLRDRRHSFWHGADLMAIRAANEQRPSLNAQPANI